ncbi:MAG: type II toxin-antitoxin system VapC family toxin [Coriobacteriia bacterium]|nr:type II toxin-antitoxin system VapC family toxin [Coriobacteriia bacterium]
MIILDTNVISEIQKSTPDKQVIKWLNTYGVLDLCTTVISHAEIWYGLERMPDSNHKTSLKERYEAFFFVALANRVLPFNAQASFHYSNIRSVRERSGRPIDFGDAQIAAIAHSLDAPLATRNIKDFEGTGIHVINPWDW